MHYLGIHGEVGYGTHDTGLAIVNEDGGILSLYIEERYSRVKHDWKFPKNCLLKLPDDEYKLGLGAESNKQVIPKLNNNISLAKIEKDFAYRHHISHACESFFTSGFPNAASLVIDGVGTDKESITLGVFNNSQYTVIKQYKIDNSLGVYYNDACSFAGLHQVNSFYHKEGNFMGLSAYGQPYFNRLNKFSIEDGFHYKVKDTEKYFQTIYPYILNQGEDSLLHYANFAATIQLDFDNAVMTLVQYLKDITHETNICLSGGCFQNVITNNKICESGIFENVWCSPCPHDGGVALGDVYYYLMLSGNNFNNNRMQHAYWGEEYPDEKILSYIDREKYSLTDITPQEVAKLLSEDKILAWFQDRSEYGPRALGHRSLIGNPGNRENFNILNNKIKHRENWRPLAPSVPDELFDILFDVKSKDLTQFMLRSIPIREEWRSRIPAVCHVDGTTRPQRLERDINPEYYNMIMEFYKLTELPCVINTSFNGPGEPIIENPKEALNFLDRTEDLYGVVFNGRYLVKRK